MKLIKINKKYDEKGNEQKNNEKGEKTKEINFFKKCKSA